MKIIYTECDICHHVIKQGDTYYMISTRIKGVKFTGKYKVLCDRHNLRGDFDVT